MKIIIKEENRKKLEKALETGQGYSKVRIVTVDDIFEWEDKIEKKFDDVATYRLKGTTVVINPWPQRFSNRYNGVPRSTWLVVKKYSSGWALIGVYRWECSQRESWISELPKKAQEGILMNYQSI